MARQFKKHIIKAEDVDPNCVFMANKKPCLIESTKEPGWKRGKVNVVRSEGRFYAVGKFFDGSYGYVPLQSVDTDFYFADIHGYASLMKLPETWLADQRKIYEATVKDLEKAKNMLDQIEEQFKRRTHEAV